MKKRDLEELRKYCEACEKCELSRTRTNLVFGDGTPDAAIMFVGEAPGADEDRQGIPFVGRAGQLLNKLLADIGLERGDVYIANILKCRPPNNRDPKPDEVEACKENLWAQIAIIQPRVMCMLGRHAATTLLGRPDFKISKEHGKVVSWRGVSAMPIFHPAAALHQPHYMEQLREDFTALKKFLDSGGGF